MELNRRNFLAGVTLAGAGMRMFGETAKKPAPNVLLIAVEGLGGWMTGIQGNKEIHTPNLDILARSGTRFPAACSASPVPDAGLKSLLSGLTPMQVAGADPGNLMERALAGGGYKTTALISGPMDSVTAALLKALDSWQAGQQSCAFAHYAPLTEVNSIPDKYRKPYDASNFSQLGWLPAVANASYPGAMKEIGPNLRKSAAAITAFDDQLPAIQTKLRERGLVDSTLLILAGTNGVLLGRHGLWGDGRASKPPNMYAEVIEVPLFLQWPGQIPTEGARPEVVSLYDVLPTVCDITGATPQRTSCGRSLSTAVFDRPWPKKQSWRNFAFAEYEDTMMGRDKRYKLVVHPGGAGELYDLSVDPGEMANRIADPQFLQVRDEFMHEIHNWKQHFSA